MLEKELGNLGANVTVGYLQELRERVKSLNAAAKTLEADSQPYREREAQAKTSVPTPKASWEEQMVDSAAQQDQELWRTRGK